LTVDYLSGGQPAQAVLYIGRVEAPARELYRQARAKVVSSTLVAGTIYTIELDRNINPALKDTGAGGATYPADPAQQRLFFQPRIVDGAAPNAVGFAMTERVQIEPGTLTLTGGGNTQFDIDVSTGAKLFTVGCRYDTPGVDLTQDLVSVLAEPTVAVCAGSATSARLSAVAQFAISSWDAYGGQRGLAGNCLDVVLENMRSTNSEPTSDPDRLSNRTAWYPLYALTYDIETGKIAQASSEGSKNVGQLVPVLIMTANNSAGNNARFTINSDPNRSYRVMARTLAGVAPPGSMATDLCFATGPGF
jgi:hypothetical protein